MTFSPMLRLYHITYKIESSIKKGNINFGVFEEGNLTIFKGRERKREYHLSQC